MHVRRSNSDEKEWYCLTALLREGGFSKNSTSTRHDDPCWLGHKVGSLISWHLDWDILQVCFYGIKALVVAAVNIIFGKVTPWTPSLIQGDLACQQQKPESPGLQHFEPRWGEGMQGHPLVCGWPGTAMHALGAGWLRWWRQRPASSTCQKAVSSPRPIWTEFRCQLLVPSEVRGWQRKRLLSITNGDRRWSLEEVSPSADFCSPWRKWLPRDKLGCMCSRGQLLLRNMHLKSVALIFMNKIQFMSWTDWVRTLTPECSKWAFIGFSHLGPCLASFWEICWSLRCCHPVSAREPTRISPGVSHPTWQTNVSLIERDLFFSISRNCWWVCILEKTQPYLKGPTPMHAGARNTHSLNKLSLAVLKKCNWTPQSTCVYPVKVLGQESQKCLLPSTLEEAILPFPSFTFTILFLSIIHSCSFVLWQTVPYQVSNKLFSVCLCPEVYINYGSATYGTPGAGRKSLATTKHKSDKPRAKYKIQASQLLLHPCIA